MTEQNYISQFQNIEKRPEAWKQLRKRNKIPSIGGRPVLAPIDDELGLAFEELSPVAQKDVLENHQDYGFSRAELKVKKFFIDSEKEQFSRFKRQDQASATHLSCIEILTENWLLAIKCTWRRSSYLKDKHAANCPDDITAEQLIEGYGVGAPDQWHQLQHVGIYADAPT